MRQRKGPSLGLSRRNVRDPKAEHALYPKNGHEGTKGRRGGRKRGTRVLKGSGLLGTLSDVAFGLSKPRTSGVVHLEATAGGGGRLRCHMGFAVTTKYLKPHRAVRIAFLDSPSPCVVSENVRDGPVRTSQRRLCSCRGPV